MANKKQSAIFTLFEEETSTQNEVITLAEPKPLRPLSDAAAKKLKRLQDDERKCGNDAEAAE